MMDDTFSGGPGTLGLTTDSALAADPNSLYSAYVSSPSSANDLTDPFAPVQPDDWRINYADAIDPDVKGIGYTRDVFQLDTDPFGKKTEAYGRSVGLEADFGTDTVAELSVFGKKMSAEYLRSSEAGRELLSLAERNRKGLKRGFLESITDFSWSDFPFVSLFATVGGSIKDAAMVSGTFKKLQNGDDVTDEEIIKTSLYLEEQKYRENGTWGATVGDIIRAAPGFMVEFLASGGLFSAGRAAATKAVGAGVHLGMSRASKTLAREATEYFAQDAVKKSVGKLGAKAFTDLVEDGTKDKIVKRVTTQVLNATMRDNPVYRGMSETALRSMAENRAEYEFAKMLARNSNGVMRNNYNRFTQWLGQNVSRGLMDFGQWGTEESTVLFTEHSTAGRALADAVGTFFVEAPVKGAALMAPNQLLTKPLVESLAGVDKGVSASQLSLQTSAYMRNDEQLMANAESIAFGMNMLEYVSENTGRGLKSLLRAGGLGLERAGVKGLVPKTTLAINELGGIVPTDPEAARSFGGKIREMVTKALGSREEFVRKAQENKLETAAKALGITSNADRTALDAAIRSGNTSGLRRDIADRIGGDVTSFVDRTVREAYDKGAKDLQYTSYARFAVANWMAKHNVGPETVMNLYEQMGYDGVLGEMFEERYSDVVKGMLGLDDRAEHDFFSNLKEAVKGLYPGWDQLTAEAVGFAMPLASRAAVMRLQSSIGGGGRLRDIRTRLEGIIDALLHDSAMSMKYGTYLKLHEHLTASDNARIEELNQKLDAANAAGDEKAAEDIGNEVKRLEKVRDRRVERHGKFVSSLPEAARQNAEEIVTVPLLTDGQLADDEQYARTPDLNSEQASQALVGQNAMLDYAPELAKILYQAEAPLEGEKPSWYRRAAHKIVGLAGAAVTGDMSLAATNPEQWVARDMGLPANVCRALKEGFRQEFVRQSEKLRLSGMDAARLRENRVGVSKLLDLANDGFMSDGETKYTAPAQREKVAELKDRLAAIDAAIAETDAGRVPTYQVASEDVYAETQKSFAAKARQIMSSYLAVHQLRSFSDGQIKDQALAHVAKQNGYEYSVDKSGEVMFGKFTKDGGFVDGTLHTASEFYDRNREAVDKAHEQITLATADLLTRHLTKSHDADIRLMNAIRFKPDSDLLDTAIYDTALNLIGSEGLVHTQRIDGKVPLSEALYSNSVARVSADVMSYIAKYDSVDAIEDRRSIEAAAYSLGLRFDGTQQGLRERDEKIFRMAKIANFVDAGDGRIIFSKPTAYDEDQSRIHANGNLTLVAVKQKNGTYTVDVGYTADGKRKQKPLRASGLTQLHAMMRDRGYTKSSARILFTQAKVIESDNMFHLIRDLDLAEEYLSMFGDVANQGKLHPMLRKENGHYIEEDRAEELLAKDLALAAKWDGSSQCVKTADVKPAAARAAWERTWGENGYMRLGERLLERHGVTKNTVSAKAGDFAQYSPVLYTLGVNAYKYSNKSSDVLVPVDPLVNEDMTSGVLNAVLLSAFAKPSSQRILRNHFNSTISDFVRTVDAALELAKEKAAENHDADLVRDINRARAAFTAGVDEEVVLPDGTVTFRKGTGFRAQAFVQFASAFCCYRAEQWKDNPHLRAFAVVAKDVRRAPVFLDFCNLVDLCLGGNGFVDEATRHAIGAEQVVANQRGLQQLVSYATGDANAFKKAVRESLPGGMSYTAFVEGCIAHMNAMAKAPAVTQEEADDLRQKAAAADLADDSTIDFQHFTTVGQLYAIVSKLVNQTNGMKTTITKSMSQMFSDIARGVLEADTRSTGNQRAALERTLELMDKAAVADPEKITRVTELREASKLRDQLKAEQRKRVKISGQILDLKRIEKDIRDSGKADELADRLAVCLAQIDKLTADYEKVSEKIRAGATNLPPTYRRLSRQASALGGVTVKTEDGPAPADSFSIAMNDDVSALPEVFGQVVKDEVRKISMKYGVNESENLRSFTRGQARLAVNVGVRATMSLGDAVGEIEVAKTCLRLFPSLSAKELEDIRTAYRLADNQRLRKGLTWDEACRNGGKWTFLRDDKDEEDTSSDDLGDKALAEYNSQAVADFLALAERCSPETSRNLQGFLKLSREASRRAYAAADALPAETADAVRFLHDLLNPKMNELGKTQAQHDALHRGLLMRFDTDAVDGVVSRLLEKGADGNTISRRGAFLVAYLASLPKNARIRFGKIVAHSVAATPLRHNDRMAMEKAFRASHGRVSENIVGDSFLTLVGMKREDLPKYAAAIRRGAEEIRGKLLDIDADDATVVGTLEAAGIPLSAELSDNKSAYVRTVLDNNAAAVAKVVARFFGVESPLYSAFTSEMAKNYRHGEKDKTLRGLAEAVSWRKSGKNSAPGVAVLDTIADTVEALASFGKGDVTREEVSAAFVAAFATGSPKKGSLRSAPRSAIYSDPLMAFLVTFSDSLPSTIMTAEVDQERDSGGGSSVAVAPRDVVPLVARWLYSNAETKGDDKKAVTFEDVCARFFGVTDPQVIARCRQDACWPDAYSTPICAKNLSVSYNNKELLAYCEKSYDDPDIPVFWVPLYAGDHNSSVMLQIPKTVQLAEVERTKVEHPVASFKSFVCNSGAAEGSDSAWEKAAGAVGASVNAWRPTGEAKSGNRKPLTAAQHKEGLTHYRQAAAALGRTETEKENVLGLMARNWFQVKNSDAVFAVSRGFDENGNVLGGTGYAVQMAKDAGKPIHVFDQNRRRWLKWTGAEWKTEPTPALTKKFAGIGTRQLTEAGAKAIENTFKVTRGEEVEETAAYLEEAKAVCEALGVGLMFTDAKRSAISSLEAQGASMIGCEVTVEDTPDGPKQKVRYGENRVHIVKSLRDEGGAADDLMSEAWKGSTFIDGYGANALKEMAQDPKSAVLKAHLISTHGYDLFFGKSLSVATDAATGQFLENSSERVVMDYLAKCRGKDELSTHILTDFDSYKVGPANSKAIRVWNDGPGKKGNGKSLMGWLFSTLEKKGKKGKKFSNLAGDELDAEVGPIQIHDLARGTVSEKKISEILPGVRVDSVDGFSGKCTIDVSYNEDGAMGYAVANVSHKSNIPTEPGRTPRNYEVDAFTMVSALSRYGDFKALDSSAAKDTLDLIANWGLVANSVYSDPAVVEALRSQSESLEELIRHDEDPDGQNAVEELARMVWARTREASNLPLSGIDAPLVSAGAAFDEKTGKVYVHTKSKMHAAMLQGSELFTKEESGFYGSRRRVALCNVNVDSKGFRYGWFLADEAKFESEMSEYFRKDDPAEYRHTLALERMFDELRKESLRAGEITSEQEAKAAADTLLGLRRKIASLFVDHHGRSIADYGDGYVSQFGFADLFLRNGGTSFDRAAVRSGPDKVFNDATGKEHVFLGGTMFGLPRTPSYNGSMWLQTVRAGLPVTEIETEDEATGEKTYRPGRDAMVSPDPVTNALLGCDHDGDKTKLYMLNVDSDGSSRFEMPPEPGDTDQSASDFRGEYLRKLAGRAGFLECVRFDADENAEVPAERDEEGAYYRISDRARRNVSNSFVRSLFNLSAALPVDEEAGVELGHTATKERYSEPGKERVKFFGGIASRGTSVFPVGDEYMKKEVVSHALPEQLNASHHLGDPETAATVSAAATDVSDSRAQIVSFAKTLHLAWASGYFAGERGGARSIFPGNTEPRDWFRFMHHVDGLSNATFDDLKEQMCTRLGWTSGMMDTVLTQVLLNEGKGRLPTTDAEFRDILVSYVDDIRAGGRFYWMKRVTDMSDTDALARVFNVFNKGHRINRHVIMNSFGIEGTGKKGDEYRIRKVTDERPGMFGQAVAQAIYRAAEKRGKGQGSQALAAIVEDAATKGGSNPVAGYLYWLCTSNFEFPKGEGAWSELENEDYKLAGKQIDAKDMSTFVDWLMTRRALLTARSFCNSVNYLAVDPGNDASFGKRGRVVDSYGYTQEFLEGSDVRRNAALKLDDKGAEYDLEDAFRRMNMATRLSYEVGNGLQTVAARVITAAETYDGTLVPNAISRRDGAARDAACGRLLLRDTVPAYDRLRLQANGQQLPYICALFDSFPELAENIHGLPFTSRADLYRVLKYMAASVGFGLDKRVLERIDDDEDKLESKKHILNSAVGAKNAVFGEGVDPENDGYANVLALRHGLESMFQVMYMLMSTSKEYNDVNGNKAIAFLRMAADPAYQADTKITKDGDAYKEYRYGLSGEKLFRIMPQFGANSEESVATVREMFRKIIEGESFAGSRKHVEDRGGLKVCNTFSLSETSIDKFEKELGLSGKGKSGLSKEDARRLRGLLREARYAVIGLSRAYEDMGLDTEAEVTPAMMFGVLLPMYSVLTSRTLGAPSPSSPSIINLMPGRYYRSMSASQTALLEQDPEFMSLLEVTQWGPRNSGTRRYLDKKNRLAVTDPEMTEDDVYGEIETAVAEFGDDVPKLSGRLAEIRDRLRGGPDVTEGRDNPDFRHSVDIFADDVFADVVDYIDEGWGADSRSEPDAERSDVGDVAAGHDAAKSSGLLKGEWDEDVARTAAAMGQLLGSWCEVKYEGGSAFTVKGRLRGNAGVNRQAVMVFTVGGRGGVVSPNDETAVREVANSATYAESLCAAVELGTKENPFTAQDFMRLPESARIELVKRFGVGGVCDNSVAYSFSGKGIATLVGAVHVGKADTTVYHEYFHSMMRMFESIGFLTDLDYKHLAQRFGASSVAGRKFNEEAAAEAFRQWVEGNTNETAKDVRSVFRRIFDFLKGLFESLVKGFTYRNLSDDQLFGMFVHGIAQTSRSGSRVASFKLDGADARAYDEAVANKDFVVASTLVSKTFDPAATMAKNRKTVSELVGQAADQRVGTGLIGYNAYMFENDTEEEAPPWRPQSDLEDHPEFAALQTNDQNLVKRNKKAAKRVVTAAREGDVNELRGAIAECRGARMELAQALGADVQWDGANNTAADVSFSVDRSLMAEMRAEEAAGRNADLEADMAMEAAEEIPMTEEASLRTQLRSAMKAGTYKVADRNDFYRAASGIRNAVENHLRSKGSWADQLEAIKKRYAVPHWKEGTQELADKAAVVAGIRRAMNALDPSESRKITDDQIRGSLAYQVALRMYASLDQSFVKQSRADASGKTRWDKRAATRYDIGAWILSTNPGAAGDLVRPAIRRARALLKRANGKEAREEIRMHIRMMERILDVVGDSTGLMDFRSTQATDEFNRIIAELTSGTIPGKYDDKGFLSDIRPATRETSETAARHLSTFAKCHEDREVQESLKAATVLAFQVQAMAKFHQGLDVMAAGAEDIEESQQIIRSHNIPKGVSAAEWMASNAIGPSNLSDNEGLVHYMNQPFFIANNVDSWLESLTRKSFGALGNIGEMMAAENREYGAVKAEIARLENYYSFMFGDNVETNGEILAVIRQKGEFKMEDGCVVRKEGGEYVKFDNYNRKYCGVRMTERDLRVIDLFKKMVAGYANGQKEIITGVDRISFRESMAGHDRSFYDRSNVEARYADPEYDDQMDPLEIALYRLTKQMPDFVLDKSGMNLYDRFADAAFAAMREARADVEAERVEKGLDTVDGSAKFNSLVVASLRKQGLVVGHNAEGRTWSDRTPVWTKAAVCLSCDGINDLFLNSEAYDKLVNRGGRKTKWLSRDTMRDEFMAVYRKAVSFAKQHPWLMHGDGQYYHAFGTQLPFWRGSGVFMYNAVRASRDRVAEFEESLPEMEERFLNSQRALDATERLDRVDSATLSETMQMFANLYGINKGGQPLVDSIMNGDFEDGKPSAKQFDVVLTRESTVGDVSQAIYDKLVSTVWDRQMGGKRGPIGVRTAERILDGMERGQQTSGEMFGGRVGVTDEQVFRKCGVLPANYQIGHKVHNAVDGLTNAMMARSTMISMLMTPAHDGGPVYYADPAKFGAEASGVPDSLWAQIARWWSEYNGLTEHGYDPKKSGVQNAKDIFDALQRQGKAKDGKYSRLSGKRYTLVSGADGDIGSVERWMVREDDQLGEESSAINALGGGEALGYLKQFTQAGRIMGLGSAAVRQTLNRCLSWSKSLSVSFSFFFPLATKWESPIGAVGAMATMASNSKLADHFVHENPEVFAGIQKMFSGRGWITKDFLGFQDIVRMMDSNDPFLAEMYSWANALGITISDRLVNPMEETKSIVAGDIRRLREMLRDKMGAEAAAKFGRMAEMMITRSGDKAFSYALNATKLACVAQLAMKLRYEAQRRGKAFDPVRDLKRYGGYINAEIGGIDPLKYAWAHPMNRAIMNTLMFSWQWTRGAWEAGGGGVIEDMLFGGHTVTRQEREIFLGRWCRMFGAVMIGVPVLMQMAVLGLAKALGGGDDDDDRWFTWQNEDKTRWTAFDLTPLLRAIEKFDDTHLGGAIKEFKRNGGAASAVLGGIGGAILGRMNGGNALTGTLGAIGGAGVGSLVPSLVPMYTGDDTANQTSRNRRYYMHFGKQGWEFFRWFDAPGNQFFSKLSMPTQRIFEGFVGRNLSYLDRALPWDEMGPWERWLNPTTDGALFNVAQAFLPFSISGMTRTGDAGVLPIFGPVSMGASQTNIQDRLEKALTAWAHNDRSGYRWGVRRPGKATAKLQNLVSDILADAEKNGFDKEDQLNKALGQVLTKEYGRLFRAIPEDPYAAFDTKEIDGIARALNRLSAKRESVIASIQERMKRQGRDWKTVLTPEERQMYRAIVTGSLANPFITKRAPERERPEDTSAYDY